MPKQLLLPVALLAAAAMAPPVLAEAPAKNWTAPAYRIYAQALSDDIMAHHPELWSVTFHGVPPGLDKVYTMLPAPTPSGSATRMIRTILS